MNASPKRTLPVAGKGAKTRTGGWTAFTENGTSPRSIVAARVVLVLAFAATIPTILGVHHGNRLFWTVAIAALPLFWVVGGYHLWRRICPLAVMGQLGRLVGRPGSRKAGDWLARNYLLIQLGLMGVSLSLRLVATNGEASWLAGFLAAITLAAVVTSFVYAGKTWCNFLCPIGLVEKIYTEPSAEVRGDAGNSQCSPCVACKKHCPDIDLEQGYWKELDDGRRRIAYFAWPGIVVGFYVYFWLASGGDWDFYFSGIWAYQPVPRPHGLSDSAFFFLFDMMPREVSAPLTLLVFGAVSYAVFAAGERLALRWRKARQPEERAVVHHRALALAGFVGFNCFYFFAGQPSLRKLPPWVVQGAGVAVVFASAAIFFRRWRRREAEHVQERFAEKLLKKWEWGDQPPSNDLQDIYLLHTERTKQREARLRAYKETIREMVADGILSQSELTILNGLRAQLGISDKDHQKTIAELSHEERQLFDPAYRGSVEQRLLRQQYHRDLERAVVGAARLGAAPSPSMLEALRAEHRIGAAEARDELAKILAPDGPVAALYRHEVAAIEALAAAAAACSGCDAAPETFVRHLAIGRGRQHLAHALAVLVVLSGRDEPRAAREDLEARPSDLGAALRPLDGAVDPSLLAPLAAAVGRLTTAGASDPAPDAVATILAIADDTSPHLRGAAAMLLSRWGGETARSRVEAALGDHAALVREAAARALAARDDASADGLTSIEKMMLLRQVPMFAELDADELDELAQVARERHADAGQDLCREGDVGVFLLIAGKVLVFTGDDERVLAELGPGACVGEMAVLDREPRSATVRAVERTRCLMVPGGSFQVLLCERPEMARAIIAELVRRMRRLGGNDAGALTAGPAA